jgi:dipeptidyl aminopeptidase/acylaminoacyl peptidase
VRLAALLGVVAAVFFVHGAHARPQACNANLAWQDRFPAWSPNGDTIAFVRQQVGCDPPPESLGFVTPGRAAKIYGVDGRRGSWAPPSWAPSGLAVAYERQRESMGVTAPSGPVGDDGSGEFPSWAGNGIAYTIENEVRMLDLPQSTRRTLMVDYLKPTQSNGVPAWSPDQTRVALGVRMLNSSDGGIAVINADGSGARVIAVGPNQSVNPTWSPDGTRLAFETNRDGNFDIYSVRADGTNLSNLTNSLADDRMPAWHGSTIAFISNRAREPQDTFGFGLYTMSEDGRVQTWRAADLHPYSPPAWSPDGSKLAYSSGRECLRWGIYTLDLATNHSERLTNNCQFLGTPRNDLLRGTPFRDYLGGGAGDDVIAGLGGPDRISGGPGNDRLDGGPGNDHILGEQGRDTIRCGSGRDTVIAERKDRVARDCERVQRY